MINDMAKLMNDVAVTVGVLFPETDNIKLSLRLEEILSNYEIHRKTVADLENDLPDKLDLYLSAREIEGLSRKTLKGYSTELRLFNKFLKKPVVQINTSDIRAYLASDKSWMPGTIDRKLSVIKTFFGWLVQEEMLLHNPATRIKAPKKPKRLPKGLSVKELEIVRESCETLRERALMEVAYSTAARLNELANMKLSDINFQEMSVKVIGKGNKERITYLSDKAMYHLRKYLDFRKEDMKGKSDFLFIRERRPFKEMSDRNIERIVDKIEKRTGIEKKITPHVFRHSFANLAMEQGVELADLQHLLGHEKADTTLIYAQMSEERKKQAFKKYHVQ